MAQERRGNENHPGGHDRESSSLPWHTIIQSSAQNLLGNPYNTSQELGSLRKKLGALVKFRDPLESDYAVARGVHQAVRGALGTITDVEVVRSILPNILVGRTLEQSGNTPSDNTDITYTSVMNKIYKTAKDNEFGKIEADPMHPYRLLLDSYPDVFDKYYNLQQQSTRDNPPAPTENIDDGIRDTIEVVEDILKAYGIWQLKNAKTKLTAHDLAVGALRNAHRLSWLASIDRDSTTFSP